ncbi:relaxase/mobilization nuclease domain-containing protein, partial [Aeromonas media]|uniref:relaxase/mobilization nuclease domain-containing protein n=1 Tax=Aeromonas media TaxID=651 RepID=UPI00370C6097
MINKMKMRKGGYRRGVSNSAKYLLKTKPEGDAIDCSIERLEGETDQAYANRIEKIFESARVPNQQNLYQFNMLSLHPSEGDKFTDAQMIEMAKEVYLKNGVKNSSNENRHYMFVVERNTEHHHVHAMIHL